ncbi:hypothetical protein [Streptomyces sp. HPF1205]|uniref:hypothetical protein n=1 Tax=Streptomyces sp. HPF1205 TaxID=2873262 RepID=UPI001CEC4C76|nr:hypothetical protein [Streptomyces sp. HPF1205]
MIPQTAPLSRRRVLAVTAASAVAAGAVTGCSPSGGEGRASARSLPEPGAAERTRALRDSTALLAAYDAAVAARPSLAARLGPLRAEVARHVTAFGGAPAAPPAATAKPPSKGAAAPSAKPPAKGAAATAGGRSAPTPADLAAMERALADRRTAALLDVPGDLARLLASVAAAGAAHAVLLAAGHK